jgi:hypothetical protein
VVSNVWRNSSLSEQFTASDSGGSGLANSADVNFTLTASEESSSANQPTVASRTVSDVAGNATRRKVSALIDLTDPQLTPSLTPQPNAAGWNREDVTVTLNATDNASGVKEISYSINGGQLTTVQQSSVQISPIATEGETTISYFATDNATNQEVQQTLKVKLDKSAPTGSVTINNGNSRTRTRSVTLRLKANDPSQVAETMVSGVKEMRISNTQSGLQAKGWVDYTTPVLWKLSRGEGTKKVWVQFRDAAGNESAVVMDQIRYLP